MNGGGNTEEEQEEELDEAILGTAACSNIALV
jgi:hypothetical protein